ncbi:hypothetical protein NL676_016611 [Syzygium grande]|nr:hypothetical protein NL676_016611 [Syzygium grande]
MMRWVLMNIVPLVRLGLGRIGPSYCVVVCCVFSAASAYMAGLNAAAEALTSPLFLVTTWIGSEGDRSIVEIEKKQTVGTCFFPRIYSTIVEVVNKQPWPGDD